MKALFQRIFGLEADKLVGEAALIQEIKEKLNAPQQEPRKPLFVEGTYVGKLTMPTFYINMSSGASWARAPQGFAPSEMSSMYTQPTSHSHNNGAGMFVLGAVTGALLF